MDGLYEYKGKFYKSKQYFFISPMQTKALKKLVAVSVKGL